MLMFRTPTFRTLLLLLILAAHPLKAQLSDFEYDSVFRSIRVILWHGDKSGLERLGEMLDDKHKVTEFLGYHQLENTVGGIAARTLGEWLIPDDGAKLPASGKAFDAFWKTNGNAVRFSLLTRAYFLHPPEDRTYRYEITQAPPPEDPAKILNAKQQEIRKRLKMGHVNDALNLIGDIARLQLPEAQAFLLQVLNHEEPADMRFGDSARAANIACYGLRFYPSEQTIAAIRKAVEAKKVDEDYALGTLERITCIPSAQLSELETFRYDRMTYYIDSLRILEKMRAFGYGFHVNFSPDSMPSKVSYYGRIFCEAQDDDALQLSALQDMLATHDPLALKYIAGQVFQRRSRWNVYYFDEFDDLAPIPLLEKLTGVTVSVEQKGQLTHELEGYDYDGLLHYVSYWCAHYTDYTWSDKAARFVNTKGKIAEPDEVEALIRQLGAAATPASEVNATYMRLTESDPEKIKAAVVSNKELLEKAASRYWGILPLFMDRRLPEQAAFTAFCRANGIAYHPAAELQRILDTLHEGKKVPRVRVHQLEDSLIRSIGFEDMNAMEYWSSLSERATYSVGRIMDEFYTLHFTEMVNDEKQLRLYLKKCGLYDRFGIIGNCNQLRWKFYNCDADVKSKLRALKAKEKDDDILASIDAVLADKTGYPAPHGPEKDDFPLSEKTILAKLAKIDAISDPYEKADKYIDMQYEEGFAEWIRDYSKSAVWVEKIKPAIEFYSRKKDLGNFDKGQAFGWLRYLEHVQESYGQQLEAALAIDDKDIRKSALNRVILVTRYSDIPELVQHWTALSKKDYYEQHTVLRSDLGLLTEPALPGWSDTLLARYKRLPEKEVYALYMKEAHADIFGKDGQLDFSKVDHMLQYGAVTAYVGGGGGVQSDYLYGTMRLLELTFDTRLGFPRFFYHVEATSGFITSPYDRAKAWRDFLVKQKLVVRPEHEVPSFSADNH